MTKRTTERQNMTKDEWFIKVNKYGLTGIYRSWRDDGVFNFDWEDSSDLIAAVHAGLLENFETPEYLKPTWLGWEQE